MDTCIEAFVIRGAMQMAQFFSGENTAQFQWLEVKEDEDHLNRPGRIALKQPIGAVMF